MPNVSASSRLAAGKAAAARADVNRRVKKRVADVDKHNSKAAAEPKAKKAGTQHRLRFIFNKETKGAVSFTEVDGDGMAVEMASAVVGTIYLRKSALPAGKKLPQSITVTVEI